MYAASPAKAGFAGVKSGRSTRRYASSPRLRRAQRDPQQRNKLRGPDVQKHEREQCRRDDRQGRDDGAVRRRRLVEGFDQTVEEGDREERAHDQTDNRRGDRSVLRIRAVCDMAYLAAPSQKTSLLPRSATLRRADQVRPALAVTMPTTSMPPPRISRRLVYAHAGARPFGNASVGQIRRARHPGIGRGPWPTAKRPASVAQML